MGTTKQMTCEELHRFLEENQAMVMERLRSAGMFEPYFRRWTLPPPPSKFVVPGVNPGGTQVVVETRIRQSLGCHCARGST